MYTTQIQQMMAGLMQAGLPQESVMILGQVLGNCAQALEQNGPVQINTSMSTPPQIAGSGQPYPTTGQQVPVTGSALEVNNYGNNTDPVGPYALNVPNGIANFRFPNLGLNGLINILGPMNWKNPLNLQAMLTQLPGFDKTSGSSQVTTNTGGTVSWKPPASGFTPAYGGLFGVSGTVAYPQTNAALTYTFGSSDSNRVTLNAGAGTITILDSGTYLGIAGLSGNLTGITPLASYGLKSLESILQVGFNITTAESVTSFLTDGSLRTQNSNDINFDTWTPGNAVTYFAPSSIGVSFAMFLNKLDANDVVATQFTITTGGSENNVGFFLRHGGLIVLRVK